MPTAPFTTRRGAGSEAEPERIARAEDRSAFRVANHAIRAFVEERRAVRDPSDAGPGMVARESTGAAPEDVRQWMLADGDRPFPAARRARPDLGLSDAGLRDLATAEWGVHRIRTCYRRACGSPWPAPRTRCARPRPPRALVRRPRPP